MRIGIVTREWPPDVYGGAGVHIEHLVAAMRSLPAAAVDAADGGLTVDVHCFGAHRDRTPPPTPCRPTCRAPTVRCRRSVSTSRSPPPSARPTWCTRHTWYANTAGLLASLVHGAPHVVTAHSLEPRRPWKADQLGGGYRLSSWVERTAYLAADAVIAVSHGMRADVLDAYPDLDPARVHVVGNGVDAEAYRPIEDADVVRGARRRPRPAVRPVRRPDHPAEGRDAPAGRGRAAAARGRPGALRRRRRHPRRAAAGGRRGRASCRPGAAAWSGSRRCCRASSWSR